MTEEQLDAAEENAYKLAEAAAYRATEGVTPNKQKQVYDTMKCYICTGIRIMREEIENLDNKE